MGQMLKYYFSEKRVWLYICLTAALMVYVSMEGILTKHWWVMLLIIPIAPFYEWFAHKYFLHVNVGNIAEMEVPNPENYEIGQYVEFPNGKQILKGDITAIKGNKLTVSSGWAKKLPWLFYFMDDLHYGHHKKPDYIPLIFAPTLAVFMFYIQVFLLSWLVSWDIEVGMTFLLGSMIYYLHYEWMHLGHHVKGYHHVTLFGRKMKEFHSLHHYKNENYWWGITNPLGDILLGTLKGKKAVKRSKTTMRINAKKEEMHNSV